MIRSENNLSTHAQVYFQNEAYIPQLFTMNSHLDNPVSKKRWWSGVPSALRNYGKHLHKRNWILKFRLRVS